MSRKVRLILGVIGVVIFAALCWFFLLSPIRGDIADTKENIQEQTQQRDLAKTTLAQSESLRAEGQKNQGRLLELNKMVPPAEELPSLLLQLQDLADQSGIMFISVSPGEPKTSDSTIGYQILPLELQFVGTYFDVSDFVYRAEQMAAGPGRLLAIKSIGLELEETGLPRGVSPALGVTINVYAFMLGGGSAAPAIPATPTEGAEGSEEESTEQ